MLNAYGVVRVCSLSLSVLAVEINPKLVAAGEENMALNGVTNVHCMCVNAQYFSRNMLGSQTWTSQSNGQRYNFGAVLVDPPRAGLDDFTRSKAALHHVHLLQPASSGARCTPTLARAHGG